jgi:osmotically-inducible protein OsmY
MKTSGEARCLANSEDMELARRVQLFLYAKRGGFQRISVGAEAGAVRLSGPVGSYFLRQTAVSLAKRVAGVRCVVDELQVYLNEADPSRSNGAGRAAVWLVVDNFVLLRLAKH